MCLISSLIEPGCHMFPSSLSPSLPEDPLGLQQQWTDVLNKPNVRSKHILLQPHINQGYTWGLLLCALTAWCQAYLYAAAAEDEAAIHHRPAVSSEGDIIYLCLTTTSVNIISICPSARPWVNMLIHSEAVSLDKWSRNWFVYCDPHSFGRQSSRGRDCDCGGRLTIMEMKPLTVLP
ncbi:hypothetical protein JOB18_005117 [Solea senegalensis]|uniref:Uncharacterized protein n=1 Tax=Solea senegalensis TaxID=28829 RepID=A0AAV6QEA6_SOLSE|nr:hypothetical protein JOB18_005117 [Solea senegalensis]